MTGYCVTSKDARVTSGEFSALFAPRLINGPTRYPVVACHGYAGDWYQFLSSSFPNLHKLLVTAANNGIPAISDKLGGDTWGNSVGVAKVGGALTAVAAETGCSSSKVHLVGGSMGAAVALEYAIANPSKVATMTLVIPAVSLVSLYNSNAGGYRAVIGAAWGVTYPTALPSGANILANAATIGGIPTRMYYAPDDALITPSDVTALATAMGANASATATNGGGHTDAGALPTAFDFQAWANWLKANGG